MSAYLDTSLLVSVFLIDGQSPRAQNFVSGLGGRPAISTWAVAEFASAVAARARAGTVTNREAIEAFALFDQWIFSIGMPASVEDDDIRVSGLIVRRPGVALKTPDALHIAICQRLGLELATIDAQMASAATKLGLAVAAV